MPTGSFRFRETPFSLARFLYWKEPDGRSSLGRQRVLFARTRAIQFGCREKMDRYSNTFVGISLFSFFARWLFFPCSLHRRNGLPIAVEMCGGLINSCPQ